MEKSTKDTELEKLQKRVEKLEKANKSLKKDKRNLKRRLTTSQNKSNKCKRLRVYTLHNSKKAVTAD